MNDESIWSIRIDQHGIALCAREFVLDGVPSLRIANAFISLASEYGLEGQMEDPGIKISGISLVEGLMVERLIAQLKETV